MRANDLESVQRARKQGQSRDIAGGGAMRDGSDSQCKRARRRGQRRRCRPRRPPPPRARRRRPCGVRHGAAAPALLPLRGRPHPPAAASRTASTRVHPASPRLTTYPLPPGSTQQLPAARRGGGRPQQEGRPPRASRAGSELESEQHELPDRRDLSPCRARIGESRPPDWGSRDSDAGSLPPSLPG